MTQQQTPAKLSKWIFRKINVYTCEFLSGTTALETQGALIMLLLGLWILFADMFTSCPHVYKVMLSLARQNTWGMIFTLLGAIQLLTIRRGNKNIRKWILLLKGAIWVSIFCAALFSEWRSPVVPIYLVLAIGAFRGFLCISSDA